jgi:hypothetical protein
MSELRRFVLRRLARNDLATFGQLEDAELRVICVTLEEPWRDNERSVSCIPVGRYPAHRRLSQKRNTELFELEHVPGRSNIEIHVGNTTADTEGCVLLGTNYGQVNGQQGITGSRDAFRKFMDQLHGVDRIEIDVIDPID